MDQTLLYRWFGLGKIPRKVRVTVESEGIILLEEGVNGSVTFRNFHAPGKHYQLRRNWFIGSLVITNNHFLAFTFFRPIIGVPLDDQKIRALDISLENNDVLLIIFDVSVFHEGWQGIIECRYTTTKAPLFLDKLQDYIS